jgi:hypothetical protein
VKQSPLARLLSIVALFGIAFGIVEGSVVVYLRGLHYPGGFTFPLVPLGAQHLQVEVAREAATIVMLVAFALGAVRGRWERFAVFMIAFGVWDLVYYLWLWLVLEWPGSVLDWDVLFLIPMPWIGPVAAPAGMALLMSAAGVLLLARRAKGWGFAPGRAGWTLGIASTGLVLWTFMRDTAATLHGALPEPYRYDLFLVGCAGLLVAFLRSFQAPAGNGPSAP